MPPTPIPENYGIAVAKLTLVDADQTLVCTFGFHNTGLETADTNASAISGIWQDNFTAASTLDSYIYAGMYVLQNLGGTLQSAQTTDNIAGTVNADPVSPAVAVRVSKETLFAGRKYRGRMYLPPAYLAEANVNDAGVIDGATVDSLNGKVTGLLADLDTNGTPMYLLHADESTPSAVINLLVRNSVGTQRRRQHLS